MNTEKAINELNNKLIKIQKMGWIENKFKGNGAIGLTFEKLIGKEIENFEIPDYEGIEIKTKLKTSHPYIRLFSAVPDGYLFEIKRIHEQYGFMNGQNLKVFCLSIVANKIVCIKNRYYFKLKVDKNRKKIFLKILDKFSGTIDENVSWSFELLTEKIERKLTYLAIITGEQKKCNQKKFFKYNKINFYKLKHPDIFIKLIELGYIKISFNITEKYNVNGEKKIYDHGTSFSISKHNLIKLFNQINFISLK